MPVSGRRRLLVGGLGACAATGVARGTTEPVQVAPGLYVLAGVDEDASPANLDAIANVGFIIGEAAVAVMDPGGSLAHGVRLRRAIEQVTPLPVRHIVLSHVHPDHVMGGAAFADCNAEVIGHAALPAILAQRQEFYAATLAREMGAAAAGSRPLAPTQLVARNSDLKIDLGGRVLTITAHPPAHTNHDLSLLDSATGTLWLADLLFVGRIPSLDGSLPGWRRVLEELQGMPAVARAIPGHGPASVTWPDAAEPLARYLKIVELETRAAIAAGIGLAEAPQRVAVGEAARWRLGEAYHGRNVTAAYRELEWE